MAEESNGRENKYESVRVCDWMYISTCVNVFAYGLSEMEAYCF